MQRVLSGLTFLLLASAAPAAAMDPSAQEETNCLMACDANQENCYPSAHMPPAAQHARMSTTAVTKLSRGSRAANVSHADRGLLPGDRLR
jgi:hypothetical protein